jgi:hypothetical protein
LLTVFGWLTNCVDPLNLGCRIRDGDLSTNGRGLVTGKRRLTHDADPQRGICGDIGNRGYDCERSQIAGNSFDLDMIGPTDHNNKSARLSQFLCRAMRSSDERASCIDQGLSRRDKLRASTRADAVRGNHDVRCGRQFRTPRLGQLLETAKVQLVQHDLVVHQFTIDGDRTWLVNFRQSRERVAYAKAHASRGGGNDFHGFFTKRLMTFANICKTKYSLLQSNRPGAFVGGSVVKTS